MNKSILSSEWILINIAFDTLLNTAQKTQVETFEAPLSTNTVYADRVSRTGAPKYFW